jgi:hypothetical protein
LANLQVLKKQQSSGKVVKVSVHGRRRRRVLRDSLTSFLLLKDFIAKTCGCCCMLLAVTLRFVPFHFVPGHFVPVILSPEPKTLDAKS